MTTKPPPQLTRRICICGCKASFSSTRPEDRYASLICKELHLGKRFVQEEDLHKRSLLPPLPWLTGTELALRLDTHPSVIYHLASADLIPYKLFDKTKYYKPDEVIQAIEELNKNSPHGRNRLTEFFRSR